MNVLQLTEAIAELIDFPKPTAQLMARLAREAGLLSSGGRGRYAARATSLDAANLIIALVACPNPARTPHYMRDFGNLRLINFLSYVPDDEQELVARLFPTGSTFREGIASLIDAFGDERFVAEIWPTLLKDVTGEELPPSYEVLIRDTRLSAVISFGNARLNYEVDEIFVIDPETIGRRTRETRQATIAAIARPNNAGYFRGIHSERSIDSEILVPIAKFVNGIGFDELLAARAEACRS